MYSQKKSSVMDIMWNNTTTYGSLVKESERQFSHYNFEEANIEHLRRYISENEEECKILCKKGLYLPAYDCAMKVSHYFNTLEARGAISVSDRTNIIAKIRSLAKLCAAEYIKAAELEGEALK
jgi:glycyl-tRNA synthetase alpha chain